MGRFRFFPPPAILAERAGVLCSPAPHKIHARHAERDEYDTVSRPNPDGGLGTMELLNALLAGFFYWLLGFHWQRSVLAQETRERRHPAASR